MSNSLVPKRKLELQIEASRLVTRGFETLQNSSINKSSSSVTEFFNAVGGIPNENTDPRFEKINSKMVDFFSNMTMMEIAKVLENEYRKRPNGRTLKLLGFAYAGLGKLDKALDVLNRCLSITAEDPVAIYETLGRANILKGDLDKAGNWFNKSYRYDYLYFSEIFGWEFLFVTAYGRFRMRPPVFGEYHDDFSKIALEIEHFADAISLAFGYKTERTTLANYQLNPTFLNMAQSYLDNPNKADADIQTIKTVAAKLYKMLEK